MTTEFNIGDEVWYGYPEPQPGVIASIRIFKTSVLYYMSAHKYGCKIVGKDRNEALLRGLRDDLESHERYIAKLKQEIAELEKENAKINNNKQKTNNRFFSRLASCNRGNVFSFSVARECGGENRA